MVFYIIIIVVFSIDQKRGMFSVQRDKAIRTDKNGCSESQDYDYTRDTNGALYLFKFNKKTNRVDEYVTNQSTGRFNKVKCGCGLIIGERDEYYDFSFWFVFQNKACVIQTIGHCLNRNEHHNFYSQQI